MNLSSSVFHWFFLLWFSTTTMRQLNEKCQKLQCHFSNCSVHKFKLNFHFTFFVSVRISSHFTCSNNAVRRQSRVERVKKRNRFVFVFTFFPMSCCLRLCVFLLFSLPVGRKPEWGFIIGFCCRFHGKHCENYGKSVRTKDLFSLVHEVFQSVNIVLLLFFCLF